DHDGSVHRTLVAQTTIPKGGSRRGQQHASPERPTADAHHGHFGFPNLPFAGFTPELQAGLVEEPVAVQPAAGELAASRVERELPVETDPLAVLHEAPAIARLAEAECLQPGEGTKAESVVELGHVDVA